MCGICGFAGPERGEADVAAGRAMSETLIHRGPEGHGEAELEWRQDGRVLRGWLGSVAPFK